MVLFIFFLLKFSSRNLTFSYETVQNIRKQDILHFLFNAYETNLISFMHNTRKFLEFAISKVLQWMAIEFPIDNKHFYFLRQSLDEKCSSRKGIRALMWYACSVRNICENRYTINRYSVLASTFPTKLLLKMLNALWAGILCTNIKAHVFCLLCISKHFMIWKAIRKWF